MKTIINTLKNHQELIDVFFSHDDFFIKELILNQQKEQKNAHFDEKMCDLIFLCTFLSRKLIENNIPASYCIMRSENMINIILTKMSLDDLFDFELFIICEFKKINEEFQYIKNTTVLSILNFVYSHLFENIKLFDISSNLNLNESYISAVFKKHMKTPLMSYINQQKIILSMEALTYTRENISMISELFGFSSYNYFSRSFKKYTGISPYSYYKLHNKQHLPTVFYDKKQ